MNPLRLRPPKMLRRIVKRLAHIAGGARERLGHLAGGFVHKIVHTSAALRQHAGFPSLQAPPPSGTYRFLTRIAPFGPLLPALFAGPLQVSAS